MKRYAALDDDLQYTGSQLDRDVVNESQIRLVIQTFKNKLPEIFPGREECPKTLVFANSADFVSFANHLDEGDRPRVDFDQIGTPRNASRTPPASLRLRCCG